MADQSSLCGAATAKGGTCRRKVLKPGDRCPAHVGRARSAKAVLKLAMQSVEAVAAATEVWDLFIRIYPHVEPFVDQVRGLLMPEYFWEAFYGKDKQQMELELKNARLKISVLEERYNGFSVDDRLAIEKAYFSILEISSRESSGTPRKSA
jgi:hypothetical protein